MDQLSKFGPFQAIGKFWGTLNSTQRFITLLFVSTSIVLLVVVSVVATKPKMTVLFSGLQSEDSGAIVAKLQETKVPYVIDGSAIKVPEKQVYETRMQLASQGLPQSGSVGFEIFDKGSLIGMTEFSQRLNFQRALQGELSRTIDQINEVVQSRVHIAIPEESIFAREKKEPTASVVLKLRAGGSLGSDQVAGIVHLVSSAVEGMSPNRVTIVDTNGNILSEGTDDPTGLDPRMSASQLKLKRQYERTMEQGVQSMLERVVGQNKAIVRVSAKINFDRKEKNSEIFEPVSANTGVLVSEDRLEETYNGNAASGGVAGIRASVRPAGSTGPSLTADKNGYQRFQNNVKYEVSKTTEHVITAPGQVENVSVAVMVDGKVETDKLPAIQNVVAAAAGIDPARGDKVTVESIDFDDTIAKKEEKELQAIASKTTYVSVGKTVGAVLLLFGFLFFLKTILKQISITVPQPVTVQEVPLGEVAGLDTYDGMSARSGGAAVPASGQVQPQEIAQALRRWMSE